ncbi:MAG: chorismate synthase, partial [Klebsiella michiganensis]|nr:chorismate synthase [Klebsiella michiganensis]
AIVGLEAGIGNPFFDSLESTIAHLAFSVPAVKGIEFGAGFDFASMKGSVANDQYFIVNEKVKTYSNNNGGITGGISNGMPVIFRVVIKPTPSISKEQKTINIKNMTEEVLSVSGRHDPCIVQRALVVIEAIAAISILELIK